MSVLMTSTLISQLEQYGVLVQLMDGELKVKLPQNLPSEAKPLLKELKKVMDQEQTYKLFENASLRASKNFPSTVWNWARENRPELINTIFAAEQEYSAAYRVQDMPGCRLAIERYENGFIVLNKTYKNIQTGDETSAPDP